MLLMTATIVHRLPPERRLGNGVSYMPRNALTLRWCRFALCKSRQIVGQRKIGTYVVGALVDRGINVRKKKESSV